MTISRHTETVWHCQEMGCTFRGRGAKKRAQEHDRVIQGAGFAGIGETLRSRLQLGHMSPLRVVEIQIRRVASTQFGFAHAARYVLKDDNGREQIMSSSHLRRMGYEKVEPEAVAI